MSRRGWLVLGAVVPLGAAAVLGGQIAVALGREYLPREPDYRIEGVEVGDGGDPLRLAVVGDSTVAGVGSPDRASSLPVLIARRIAGDLGRTVIVDGHGVSGAVTRDVIDEQLGDVGAGVDVVVAVVGSNDVTHLTSPWRLRGDVAALAQAVDRRTGAPLVLAGIPRFGGATALPRPLRDVVGGYARVLRDVQRAAAAETGIAFVEIARDASPRFAGVPESMSVDGFHPSPVGYGFWADAIAPVAVDAVDGRPAGGGGAGRG